jgi:hypothetical protein
MRANLIDILDIVGLAAIDQAILDNSAQLFGLGKLHYDFAFSVRSKHWRQAISRFYYATYHLSRSARFCHNGDFSQEVDDHKKIDQLPDDFPQKSTFANKLKIMRTDRNLSDYDHSAIETDLIISVPEAEIVARELMAITRSYLQGRGVAI